jgi:hypothetical protein
MNPSSFGPTAIQEGIITLGRSLSSTIYVETHYRVFDGILTLVGQKILATAMKLTLSGSADYLPAGSATQENKVIAGFAYTY